MTVIFLTLLNLITMTTTDTLSAETFTLPELPYQLNALEPQISEETMRYHYGKHHKTYIDNLNRLIRGTRFQNAPLEEIVINSDGALFNNAAQAWNHTFYFLTLSPDPQVMPDGELAEAIKRDFGSFENFKKQFTEAAATLFGSGWTWLVKDHDGKLKIVSYSNGGNPLPHGLTPLLGIDVWEHAYYIDYRNARADALANHWDVIDWKVVGQRYKGL